MNGFLTGNNAPTKLMVSVFLLDFFIRLFINPLFSFFILLLKDRQYHPILNKITPILIR
jgi:hypothetical protein